MKTNNHKSAFTLIELLVVISILGILVALVVGVGKYVRDEAKIKATSSAQTLIMTAVEAFKEAHGSYPPGNGDDESGKLLAKYLTGKQDPPGPNSRAVAAAMQRLEGISTEIYSDVDGFRDAFGTPMQYDDNGGLNGPVLISAGPDADFETKEDNIRSDGR